MRVVNDREEKSEPTELNVFGVLGHAMLSALGMMTVILGPLPMILAESRLADPLPKIAAVLGAAIAVSVLKLPIALVVLIFILGVYAADGIRREVPFWTLLAQALLLATVGAFATLLMAAQWENATISAQWTAVVDRFMAEIQQSVRVTEGFPWEVMRSAFLYEGAFIYVSMVILSLWFSVGVAAHLGWLDKNGSFSGEGLRRIRVPIWFCLGFALISLAMWQRLFPYPYLLSGIFRVAGAVMLIQGCVCLSDLLAHLVVRPRVRTLIYSVAIGVGFYALMGIAVMSPWFYRWKDSLVEKLEEGT